MLRTDIHPLVRGFIQVLAGCPYFESLQWRVREWCLQRYGWALRLVYYNYELTHLSLFAESTTTFYDLANILKNRGWSPSSLLQRCPQAVCSLHACDPLDFDYYFEGDYIYNYSHRVIEYLDLNSRSLSDMLHFVDLDLVLNYPYVEFPSSWTSLQRSTSPKRDVQLQRRVQLASFSLPVIHH